MAANVQIECPVSECKFNAGLRFDPGPENGYPQLAADELKTEHPHHDINNPWKFVKAIVDLQ